MHWVIQEGFYSDTGWNALISNLQRFGISYSTHRVVPKVGGLLPDPSLTHRNVICMGSYSMRHTAARNGWDPGVFDLFSQDFVVQREHWGAHLLNYCSVVSSIRDAAVSAERVFVRPTKDTKYFSGRVFTVWEFEAWRDQLCDPAVPNVTSLTPDTEIQISSPISIHAEYRFWVIDGEIITHSTYRRGQQIFYAEEVDDRVRSFVEDRIAEWLPHDAFVIDACDSEAGMKIIELNTLNSSAFYAGDVQRLVLSLEDRFSR